MKLYNMKFNHNDRVTCTIHGTEITDARISINKDGTPYVCQNEHEGFPAENQLGFTGSWILSKDFMNYYVKDLQLATTPAEPTWDSLAWKDFVLDDEGVRIMVLAVVNDSVLLSYSDDFEKVFDWFHKKQLLNMFYTIEGVAPAVEEITVAEAEARFGVKIKLK